MAITAVEIAVHATARFLFTREVQKTLRASAHQLLEDTIKRLGYSDYFTITNDEIKAKHNGSHFMFTGLNDLVAGDLKSIEGLDYAVICEAENLSKKSFDILNLTVRKPGVNGKPGCEIWIQFNVKYPDDFVYDFCVKNPPDNMIAAEVNGFALLPDGTVTKADNPWISTEQLIEAARLLKTDKPGFDNQCLGKPLGQGGRVWGAFTDAHIRDYDFAFVRPRAQCFMAMDPHSKFFPFCVWIARWLVADDLYTYWVYNEWPEYGLYNKFYHEFRKEKLFSEWGGLSDLAQAIFARDGAGDGLKVLRRFIDTRFAKGSGGENWSTKTQGVISELSNVGIHMVAPAERIIDIQREKILNAMRYNPSIAVNEFNRPNFYVAPWCQNIIQSCRFHRTEDQSEKEAEKHKDPSDALRIAFAGMSLPVQDDERKQRIAQEVECVPSCHEEGGWMT